MWGERKTHKYTGNIGGIEGFEETLRWGTICDTGFNEVVGQAVCEQMKAGSKFVAYTNSLKYSHFSNGTFQVLH